MTLQPCFSSTNYNLSKPQECFWNSILGRRHKWIKIVLKHFNKEYEWCHSILKYFETEYNYIVYYEITNRSFPYENYNLRYGYVFLKYLKIYSFSVHVQSMNLNQHKIIYWLRYITSNFETPEFLVTRKLCHFKFG